VRPTVRSRCPPNGSQQTLTLTDLSIIQNPTIPGAAGQGEVPLTLVYFRP